MKYVAVIESEELNGFSGFSEDTPVINVHRNSYMKQIKFVPYQSIETLLALVGKARPTGHWFLLDECSNEGVYCSNCHKKVYRVDYANQKVKSNYCPNCGADMQGGRE